MFQKLITYSIRHKLVIGVLSIALAIWGVWSLVHLPFDSTPDITDNQVKYYIKKLKDNGKIERVGTNRKGLWKVI